MGTLLCKFLYGPGIDEPICMMIPAGQSNAGTYFYHFDGLDSVIGLSNDSGQLVEAYSYSAFGSPRTHMDAGADGIWMTADDTGTWMSPMGNPFAFTGRQYDYETGLYYYRARMYNPALGRFMQPDPIGYDDGMNMYSYVGNNPANWIDPMGRTGWSIREGFVAGIMTDPAYSLMAYQMGKDIANWANREASTMVGSGKSCQKRRGAVANALQHAAWSANLHRIARVASAPNKAKPSVIERFLGRRYSFNAKAILHIHEQFGKGPTIGETDSNVDFWNNEIGRRIGMGKGNIYKEVLKAYEKGILAVTEQDISALDLWGTDIIWIDGKPIQANVLIGGGR